MQDMQSITSTPKTKKCDTQQSFYKPRLSSARKQEDGTSSRQSQRVQKSLAMGSAMVVGREGPSQLGGMVAPPDWKTHGKLQKISKPNLSARKDPDSAPHYELPKPDNSRLDAIYAQLKNLQSFKDEIMDDLNDFMDDFET